MKWIGSELKGLLTIAVATIRDDGTLVKANAGFLRLINMEGEQPAGKRVAQFFIQPDFALLVSMEADTEGRIYHGLLTLGDYMTQARTLRTRIWRVNSELRLLAEHDIEELERLYGTLLALNRDYADAQFRLAQTNLKLQQREAEILALSLTDQLTGVGNRRQLEQVLPVEISRAERTGEKFCALMADLDHFKKVNDTWGHDTGDEVLIRFGKLLRQQTRVTDTVIRFGGEEFIILMPHTPLEQATAIAERIKGAMGGCQLEVFRDPITVSIGVAELVAGQQGTEFLRRADTALYKAKASGRNRIMVG